MKVSHTVSFRTFLVLVVLLAGLGTAASAGVVPPISGSCVGDGRALLEIHAPVGSMWAGMGPWGWFYDTDASGNPLWKQTDPSGVTCVIADVCGYPGGQWEIRVKQPDGTIKSSGIYDLSQYPAPAGRNAQCFYLFDAGSGGSPPTTTFVALNPTVKPDPPLMRASYDISLPIRSLKSSGTADLVTIGCQEHVYSPNFGETRYMPPPGGETPVTKSIGPGGTATYSFRYLHGWTWLGLLDNPYNGLKDAGIRMTAAALGAVGQTVGGAGLTFLNMIVNGGSVTLESTYTYTFTSSQAVENLEPFTVTVKVPKQKRDAAFNAWNLGTVGNGLTMIGMYTGCVPCVLGEVGLLAASKDMWISASDPDMDYQHVVEREDITAPEVDAVQGPMKEVATGSMNILEDTMALTESLERYYGAEIADDEEWELIHLSSAARYSEMAATDYGQFQVALKALTDDMKNRGVSFTDLDIDAIKDQISSNGLPEVEVSMFRRLGYSDQEIEQMKEITMIYTYNDLLKNYDTSYSTLVGFLKESHEEQAELFSDEVGARALSATINVDPETINLKSKQNWITAHIEIPGSDLKNVDLTTVKLNGIPVETNPKFGFVRNPEIMDRDGDGNPELMVKFDKSAVAKELHEGMNMVILTGKISESFFL